ncbi:uncharacterized protein LOC119185806 isoform X1 [Rhipicephalus microplus]|uniref:uncharacterized protein LOC119185806 isoform X1 n=1 Tax=Rhipicephalus microplus TaxID=6941 RepID=UPI003F6D9E8D
MDSPKMGPCIASNCYPVIELAPPPSHHVTSSASPIKVGIQNFSFSGHGGPGANMWPKTPFFRIVQVFLFGLAGTHCATDVSTAYTCRMDSPKMGPCIASNCYPVIELAPPPSHHVTSSASPIKVGIQNFSFSGHGGPGANMWPKTPFFRIVQAQPADGYSKPAGQNEKQCQGLPSQDTMQRCLNFPSMKECKDGLRSSWNPLQMPPNVIQTQWGAIQEYLAQNASRLECVMSSLPKKEIPSTFSVTAARNVRAFRKKTDSRCLEAFNGWTN